MDNLLKTSLKVLIIFDWLERRSIYQDLELKEVHQEFKKAVLDAKQQKEKSMPLKSIRTPCVGICELVVPWGVCKGCGRTAVELEDWIGMTDEERDQVMLECEARLAVLLFQPERLNNKGQNNA